MREYLSRARGGRVVQTPFLAPDLQEELRGLARGEGLQVAAFGGLPLAERKVMVLYPEEVPQVSDPTRVLFLPWAGDLESLEDRLREVLEPGLLGDCEEVEGGGLVVTLPKGYKALREAGLEARALGPDELPKSRERVRSVVVPSLRVDAVGAKGFGVSRSYFAQGVKAGKVKLGGKTAAGKDEVKEGDTLLAEGLGVLAVRRVLGSTKRGNYKLEVEVHKG
ncbi:MULTISPECIES: S4 domain-containing protein [unclassified Meiothermus]|uniref:S4 domain-containing protein n=1 Tax=unclassified Meiothermus TaxID=370471 RepID=UPI000D7C8D2F|nr:MULTISPECIES: S4 domain-containing protein [unclassified Meiothermus]PZA06697.1 RNA-binding protein [Meiothermus sp. Pnk-1]RYM36623.1 RNA-binding protein [Meiothermus sp. PNK-Is4]